MRENRTYGSEGGEAGEPAFPTPITPRQTRVGEKCALAETVVCVMEPVDGVATRARVAGGRIALGVWLRLCRAILGAPSGFS